MKIESGRGVAPSSTPRRASGTGASGFAPALDAPARAATASPVSATPTLDALLALQAEGGIETERKKRQVRRGKAALDALENLTKALAEGVAPASLRAEMEALQRASERTGEEGLDALLLEIDTRLAVELAKLEQARF